MMALTAVAETLAEKPFADDDVARLAEHSARAGPPWLPTPASCPPLRRRGSAPATPHRQRPRRSRPASATSVAHAEKIRDRMATAAGIPAGDHTGADQDLPRACRTACRSRTGNCFWEGFEKQPTRAYDGQAVAHPARRAASVPSMARCRSRNHASRNTGTPRRAPARTRHRAPTIIIAAARASHERTGNGVKRFVSSPSDHSSLSAKAAPTDDIKVLETRQHVCGHGIRALRTGYAGAGH